MKTLCFVAAGFWALGELAIAVDFANRVKNAGYQSVFLISPTHEKILKQNKMEYVTLVPKSRKLNLAILKEVNSKYQPEAVILSDFLTYLYFASHYGLTAEDLSIFNGKTGTFDIYDYEATEGRIDTYGFVAKNMVNLSLKSYDFLLQPCPVNHFKKRGPKEFRYSLFGNWETRTEVIREEARKRLGIKDDQKLILITSAQWQQGYRLYDDIVPFIDACNRMMENVLEALPSNTRVISIGRRTLWDNRKMNHFTHYDNMLPDEFQNITNATDLYISNNYVSTSMIKNTLSGVPTLLIHSSVYKRGDSQKWLKYKNRQLPEILDSCPVAYPFRTFPVGWYRFLKEIVKNNPFYSLMLHAELFAAKSLKTKILTLLDNREMFKTKRLEYLNYLKTLPPVETGFAL